MEEKQVKEKIAQGSVQARVIIEIVGKPKEHVEKALNDLLKHMNENKDVDILSRHVEEPKEHEGEMWASFAELEVLLKNLNLLVGFCFDYMPSSVEIIEPSEFSLKSNELSGIINDMQSKLHNLGMALKKLKNENLFLKKNSANLLINHILVLLVNKKRTFEELTKLTGISKEELKPFLDKLLKDGKINKEGDAYTFAK